MPTRQRHSAIEIRHLRVITAIAEHGNLTAAARVLGLTQPALSHGLRDLEVRLRAPIFERTARRMVLTPTGEHLVDVARQVLADVDRVERQIAEGDFASARGKVRVATECYTAYHWLPSVLRTFHERWPSVDLTVAPEHTASPITALRDGGLDVAVVYRRPADKRIRVEQIFEDEVVIVSARGHRFGGKDFVPVSALANEHLFAYLPVANGRSMVRDILDSAEVQPAKMTRLQLTEGILELVAAGFGVAMMATWAVAPAVRAGLVNATRIGKRGYTRAWYAAVRASDVTPAWQFDLIELLRRNLGGGASAAIRARADGLA